MISHFNRRVLVLIAVALLSMTALTILIDYSRSQTLVSTLRTGCERGIVDRIAIINVSWDEAHANAAEAALFGLVKTAAGRAAVAPLIAGRRSESRLQLALATSDATRIEPAQASQIPAPLRHLATFSCVRAFPSSKALLP